MGVAGLGQDGYIRIQKEVSWGSAVTNAMTFIPANPGSNFDIIVKDIENKRVINSRLKQMINAGQVACPFTIQMDVSFPLIGAILNLFLGASSSAGPSDSTYTHTWLTPIGGERIGKSFTMQWAKGGDTAYQIVGCVIDSIKFVGDNAGQIRMEINGIGKSYSSGVSRPASVSYPASNTYANFGMFNLNIDPANDSAFDQLCNSFELEIKLGYGLERFKMGSVYTQNPVFQTTPTVMLKANIDADKQFFDAALAKTTYDFILTLTSDQYAAGTTPYKLEFEIPKGVLTQDTKIPFDNDRLSMDIQFDCSYGGTTTGSSTNSVHAEARVVDSTASYS